MQLVWPPHTTQAEPGPVPASYSSSRVQVIVLLSPPQKGALPVVPKQKHDPAPFVPHVTSFLSHEFWPTLQMPALCARHRRCLQIPEQHWPARLQRFPTWRQVKWVALVSVTPRVTASAPRALPAKPGAGAVAAGFPRSS